jgi:hypothetical protein
VDALGAEGEGGEEEEAEDDGVGGPFRRHMGFRGVAPARYDAGGLKNHTSKHAGPYKRRRRRAVRICVVARRWRRSCVRWGCLDWVSYR